MKNRMNIFLCCAAVMLLCCAVVVAQPPAGPPPADDDSQGVDQPGDEHPHAGPAPHGQGQGGHGAQRDGAGHHPVARSLSDEQETELLEFLQERMADRYELFTKLAEDNPRRYRFIMTRMWAWYRQWKDMSPEAQEASIVEHDLRMEAFLVLRKWRDEEDPDEKERLEAELRETLERHFDAEQNLRQVQLVELEQRIEQVRQELQQRIEDRDSIVTEHMNRMMRYRPRQRDEAPGGDQPADGPPPPPPPPADETDAD